MNKSVINSLRSVRAAKPVLPWRARANARHRALLPHAVKELLRRDIETESAKRTAEQARINAIVTAAEAERHGCRCSVSESLRQFMQHVHRVLRRARKGGPT